MLELKWWPFDSAVWFIAEVGATWARDDFSAMPDAADVVVFALGAVLANALVALAVGIYLRRSAKPPLWATIRTSVASVGSIRRPASRSR